MRDQSVYPLAQGRFESLSLLGTWNKANRNYMEFELAKLPVNIVTCAIAS